MPGTSRSPTGCSCRSTPAGTRALERYDPGSGTTVAEVNGDMLLVHAVAAARGHTGAARHDDRARALARLLVGPEIWMDVPPAGANASVTGPGWRAGPTTPLRHMVFDTEVVDGLVHAYLARDVLGLDAGRRAAHPRGDPRRGDERRLPLARAAARTSSTGTARCSPPTRSSTAQSQTLANGMAAHLRRFLAGPQPRGGTAVSLPARSAARPRDERGLGRVREHRAELLPLVRRRHVRPACRRRPVGHGCGRGRAA